jgi:hypothetical protein
MPRTNKGTSRQEEEHIFLLIGLPTVCWKTPSPKITNMMSIKNSSILILARSASYLELHLKIDGGDRLRTKLYYYFPSANFPFICSHIPAALAYGVYISQLIRYSRACGSYHDFLTNKGTSRQEEEHIFLLIGLPTVCWKTPSPKITNMMSIKNSSILILLVSENLLVPSEWLQESLFPKQQKYNKIYTIWKELQRSTKSITLLDNLSC